MIFIIKIEDSFQCVVYIILLVYFFQYNRLVEANQIKFKLISSFALSSFDQHHHIIKGLKKLLVEKKDMIDDAIYFLVKFRLFYLQKVFN